ELPGLRRPAGNVRAVRLDSAFNLNVPPDRPAPEPAISVDYWQPGGLYRDVRLRMVPPAYLADVFAKPVNVLDPAARQVVVQVTVDAARVPDGPVQVAAELHDGERALAGAQVPVTVTQPGQVTVTATLAGLDHVELWDTTHPKLSRLVTRLYEDGVLGDEHGVRIGFREARFALDGFYLNGRRVKLFGANRHQFFPYAGGAMPARV